MYLRGFAIVLLLLPAALSAPACAQTDARSAGVMRSEAGPELDTTAARLRSIADSAHLDDLRWRDFPDYQAQVQQFYGSAGYEPAWLRAGVPTRQALEMIKVLQDADQEGLEPEDYDASRWAHRLNVLRGPHGAVEQAPFDAALTVCAMRYASDLQVGRINPRHLAFEWKNGDEKLDLAEFVRQRLVSGSDPGSELAKVEPQLAAYQRLRRALQHYMELAKSDGGEKLGPVVPGERYQGIGRLTSLLRLLGDLPEDARLGAGSTVDDQPLVDAVQRYQRRHALEATGKLDSETIASMNVPLVVRLDAMRLGLERYRWLPYKTDEPRIEVNLPEFRLRCLDGQGRIALTMLVNVGGEYNYQTPLLEDQVQYLVFRPYWYPPPDILRTAILPELRRDPSLDDVNLEVIDGKGIQSGRVTAAMLQRMRSGKVTVRERPGTGNSEGLVKFIFPNPYDVYLHDTPAGGDPFSGKERVFSHGCIQVQEPARLAAWVLRNTPGWDLRRVETAMHQGRNNDRVDLASPMPISIVYETAVADESGEVYFFPDSYRSDAMLEGQLAKGYPYSK